MMRLLKTNMWYRLIMPIVMICTLYYGVRLMDFAIDHYILQSSMLKDGATKITKSHFRQPVESLFDKGNLGLFLERETKHKDGVSGWRPFYVILMGTYAIMAYLVLIWVMRGHGGRDPDNGK